MQSWLPGTLGQSKMLPVAVGLKGNINTFSQSHKNSSEQLTLNTAEFQSADSLASLNSGAFCSELEFFSFFSIVLLSFR